MSNVGVTGGKHEFLLRMATVASVSVAVFLVVMKLFIWGISGSVSVLASSMDSILDIIASLISFFAVRIALKPADDDHHFGHGKAEQLAALAQSSFIAGSAIYLVFYAIGDLRSGNGLQRPEIAIVSMIVSLFATGLLVLFQRYVIKKTRSFAIEADAAHYKMDIFVNLGVLVALIFSKYGWHKADPVVSIMIAVYMIFSVKKIAWEAIDHLMDKALPEERLEQIRNIITDTPQVRGFHDLRTRHCGNHPVIQYHLDLDEDISLKEAHDIGTCVKQRLLEVMPEADILFHVDPVSLEQSS